jgi:hypothetical protein
MKTNIGKSLFCTAVLAIFILPLMGNTACATSERIFCFNRNHDTEVWETNPENLEDCNESTYASTTDASDVHRLIANTCTGTETEIIDKVYIRVKGYWSGADRDIVLQPVFGGSLDGDNHSFDASDTSRWSDWFEISDDTNTHTYWTWRDVANLDCKVKVGIGSSGFTLYASKVEIKVTYD